MPYFGVYNMTYLHSTRTTSGLVTAECTSKGECGLPSNFGLTLLRNNLHMDFYEGQAMQEELSYMLRRYQVSFTAKQSLWLI